MPRGLAYTGYILALIGGILLIIAGGLSFLGLLASLPFQGSINTLIGSGQGALRDLLTLMIGIVAVIGSRYVGTLGWSIALIVLGAIGGGIGGLLVLVGGVLGLVQRYSRPRS